MEEIALCCVDLGMESLMLYSFSRENWKRPRQEVEYLMKLYTEYLVHIRGTLMNNNVQLRHLGIIEQLPKRLQKELTKSIELTSKNTGMILGLALNYSGRSEIVEVVRKIASQCKSGDVQLDDIDEELIEKHLYTAGLNEPDLLIRTANEMRISNFLLWQISYSEFYVTDTLWPDFTQQDMEKAILSYSRRDRRFGAVKTK